MITLSQDPITLRFRAAQERRIKALSGLLEAKAEWQASLVEMSAAGTAFELGGASRVESLEASMRTHQACIDMLMRACATHGHALDQELMGVIGLNATEGIEFCTLKIEQTK